MGVLFEWDEDKNEINRTKHGIDFVDVREIFERPMVTFLDERRPCGEDRWVGIGWLRDVLIVVVFSEPDAQSVRIISARKAAKRERDIYHAEIGN